MHLLATQKVFVNILDYRQTGKGRGMTPDRRYVHTDGRKVEEYYWAGSMCVYLDNKLQVLNYDQMVNFLKTGKATLEPKNV